MKIRTNQVFKNLKGETIELADGKKREPLTLGMVLAELVLAPHRDKPGFRPLKSWELARGLYSGRKEFEISLADLAQLRELVENNEFYATIITAQTLEMLDGIKG